MTLLPPALPPPPAVVDRVVAQREAVGLFWSIVARIIFMGAGLAIEISFSQHVMTTVVLVGLALVGVLLAAKGLHYVRRAQKLEKVAAFSAGYDLTLLAVLPFVWWATLGPETITPNVLLEGEFVAIALVMTVVNALSGRSRYPALVGFGACLIYLVMLAWSYVDGRLVFTDDVFEALRTEKVSHVVIIFRAVTLVFAGWFLSWFGYSFRFTLRQAVEAQWAHAEAERDQAETLMRGRLESLTKLVAGIAHEMNSPVGALASSLDTQRRAVARLRRAGVLGPAAKRETGVDVDKITASLGVLEEGQVTMREAAERIDRFVGHLRTFARLDASEVQITDLASDLRNVVGLMSDELVGEAEIVYDVQVTQPIVCRPATINQALRTVIENALEAMSGRGRLTLRLRPTEGGAEFEITDTGCGMSPDHVAHLFEPELQSYGRRVGMGLGLPAAKRGLEADGGAIHVVSEPGRGTTVRIQVKSRVPEAVASPKRTSRGDDSGLHVTSVLPAHPVQGV